jgi:phosphate ABC transporter permease protein PstC
MSDKLARSFFLAIATLSIFIIFFIFFFLIRESLPAFQNILSTTWNVAKGEYGIGAAIFGTLIVTGGAMLIAVPLGILGAIFLSELFPFRALLKPIIEVLAGIPSIVYGFIGVILLVRYLQVSFDMLSGYSFLAGSLILGLMALPIIISMSDDAMKAVPRELKEASLALGATKWQTIKKVTLPASISGISAALIMGIGRAIGETMAVSLVLGNIMKIPVPPFDIFESTGATITSLIAHEMGEASGLQVNALFAGAVVLFCIVAIMSVISNVLRERIEKRFKG